MSKNGHNNALILLLLYFSESTEISNSEVPHSEWIKCWKIPYNLLTVQVTSLSSMENDNGGTHHVAGLFADFGKTTLKFIINS